jgi:hypothetical protein
MPTFAKPLIIMDAPVVFQGIRAVVPDTIDYLGRMRDGFINCASRPSSVQFIAGIREMVDRGGREPLGRGLVIAGSNPASGVLSHKVQLI